MGGHQLGIGSPGATTGRHRGAAGGFAGLVATALVNAETQAALTASRARIVAAADTTRRRIERDLHDGAQQQLVSLAMKMRQHKRRCPPRPATWGRCWTGSPTGSPACWTTYASFPAAFTPPP